MGFGRGNLARRQRLNGVRANELCPFATVLGGMRALHAPKTTNAGSWIGRRVRAAAVRQKSSRGGTESRGVLDFPCAPRLRVQIDHATFRFGTLASERQNSALIRFSEGCPWCW